MSDRDHREDIRAYARGVEQTMADLLALASGDADLSTIVRVCEGRGIGEDDVLDERELVNEWLLDVEHTASLRGDGAVDQPRETIITLTVGGPTVRVTFDHRWQRAELQHSWGMLDGQDRTTWEMDPDVVAAFLFSFAPHPCEEV